MSGREKPGTVEAGSIESGRCFRKYTGSIAYLRLSPDTVRHYGLAAGRVYGVAFNGNMVDVEPSLRVVPVSVAEMDENRLDEDGWHDTVGADKVSW